MGCDHDLRLFPDHGDRSYLVASSVVHKYRRASYPCRAGSILAGNPLVSLLVRDLAGGSSCCVSARGTQPTRTCPHRPGIDFFGFGLPELLLCQHCLVSPALRDLVRYVVPCNIWYATPGIAQFFKPPQTTQSFAFLMCYTDSKG